LNRKASDPSKIHQLITGKKNLEGKRDSVAAATSTILVRLGLCSRFPSEGRVWLATHCFEASS